ncbi:MAG: helix-turn-helix transcriptional regulator [Firmicutes bacterium]|nr:helix-turn-helix transcriptional regulator [Bacillota bacterium]
MRENLKKARKEAGMTQKQVAEYLKVSERHYKYIESGQVVGNIQLWDMLEDLFNIHQRVLREIHHGKEDNQ